MWVLALETIASLIWISALVLSLILATVEPAMGPGPRVLGFGLAWGIAIAVIALVNLAFALGIELEYDRRAALAFALARSTPSRTG